MPILGSFGAGSGRGFGQGTQGAPDFICATGGTITEVGDYRIHTFTGPGTFTVNSVKEPSNANVNYLVIAGGGGAAPGQQGGGGAGGYREAYSAPVAGCYTASPLATPTSLPVSATSYPITVGGGGSGGIPSYGNTTPGSNSIFSSITSTGGGSGGYGRAQLAGSGGSGGGSGEGTPNPIVGGAGNTPPTSPPQGNPGATYGPPNGGAGTGGGGAAQAGQVGPNGSGYGGNGGNGAVTSISGSPTTYAGGGGGGQYPSVPSAIPGKGGEGGGGESGGTPIPGPSAGTAGVENSGGGGGAPFSVCAPGAGGSGIVIIRYKYK